MKGKFSIPHILSVDHGDSDSRPNSASAISAGDPVVLGLINLQVASCVSDYFMHKINTYISQLDPDLHTFAYLRKSPFLLTAVLVVTAKAFESDVYPDLNAHAEKLFADCFRRGDKSTKVIQAIWKEPNDSRAWTSVGLSIRIAMDLGWHRLSANQTHNSELTEIQRREQRNIERTMLVLFVYDRSLSLQTGKPWMIERTQLIESADSWWRHPYAIPNDLLLCSFVTLRLITADTFDLLVPSKTDLASRQERLLSDLDSRINGWQTKWLDAIAACPAKDSQFCHAFLINFYTSHSRLQLSSFSLQAVHNHNFGINNMKAFWLSYVSAVKMLQLVAESSPLLYLAQDSIHVMTAYAAIFLIKLTLSSPSIITLEFEKTVIGAIRRVAVTFAALSAPRTSSCSYQATFMENILSEFSRARGALMTSAGQLAASPMPLENPHTLDDHRPLSQQKLSRQQESGSLEPYNASSISPAKRQPHHNGQGVRAQDTHPSLPSDDLRFLFDDADTWADMFANAGFNIQEGVFFCE
ncbi:hypothetical protein BJX70DRAFT_399119 [Aspergillus crustosus]